MTKTKPSLPTMQELTDFLNKQTREISRREIARSFGIKGDDRAYLKHLLKEIETRGLVRRNGRSFKSAAFVPDRMTVEITGQDADGELVARPVAWQEEGQPPQIVLTKNRLKPPVGIGDVVIAKVHPVSARFYEGEALKRVTSAPNEMVGVFFDGKILSVDRRFKEAFLLDNSFPTDLKPNDLVIVTIPELRSRHPVAHFIRKIGQSTDAHAASLISIFAHHLPVAFTEAALSQAQKAKLPSLGKRTDLRGLPFVTVDGADARDFDDAVWAEQTQDGFHIIVAIADVAWFVRSGSALDADAFLRGNSTYFPDRVLPMLPEALSNGLCSLKPNEDRPVMAAEIWIDTEGRKQKHRFLRGMIRSAARLTYEEVQADFDGKRSPEKLEGLMDALHGAFKSLLKARQRRGVLELDVPERQVMLNPQGKVIAIRNRERYDSHKMIEELMILANVAAAETLEKLNIATMYRVHDRPSLEKMENLKMFLKNVGIRATLSQTPAPQDFNQILVSAHAKQQPVVVNEMVLRTQSQAEYSPENIGHFGLALEKYAHFTSPIRRYADILVHRALIEGLGLGEGGLTENEAAAFDRIAEHISATERQSAAAEQDALDRYTAAFLADRVGEVFEVRISSVTRFGLFVALDEYGADGIIPLSTLTDDHYVFDERMETLKGVHSSRLFSRGQNVQALLKEAVPLTGGLLFRLVETGSSRQRRFARRRRR